MLESMGEVEPRFVLFFFFFFFVFFFKQKTSYEVRLSLVGSESCIRDRQGYSLVPLSLYFKKGRVKLELGLCKGKKLYDKRATAAARDAKRDIERALKSR